MPADAPTPEPASLAIVNARVFTGDPRRPWADAVLVRGDRFVLVGSSAEVKKLATAGTRVIDARRRLVAPAVQGEPIARGASAALLLLRDDLAAITADTLRGAEVLLELAAGRVVRDSLEASA